jgi:glycine/D-amino acid oxidase-like deaminating enzyme
MATAMYLAQEHGIAAVVLEANQLAWGCSSRSGGQGQNASGRLKRSQWIERWGLDVARRLDTEIRAGFDNFRALTTQIDCDAHDGGHLYVAHRPAKVAVLEREGALMRDTFGYATRMLTPEQLRADFCDEREACGALHEPDGVGIHPLKFTFGLARRARALGVRLHTGSPVQSMHGTGGVVHLRTPGGTVRARRVAVCTGGYTGQQLTPLLRNRLMPILSNSVVTRPLTEAELRATNFRMKTFLTDTRTLRFYYRLLEGNRLQLGSRSSITGADAQRPEHLKLLTDAIARKFPPLAGIASTIVVGLGRRQPRHDAAHHPPRCRAEHLVCTGLRWQRRVVLHLGRQAPGRARGGQGRHRPCLRAAHLRLAAAVPQPVQRGHHRGLCPVPPLRAAVSVPVVRAAGREAVDRASCVSALERAASARLASTVYGTLRSLNELH